MNQGLILEENLTRRVVRSLIKPILTSVSKIQIHGEENIPRIGKIIIASNHLSSFDGFILQYATSRSLFFMGKAEVFKNPFSAWLMRQLGVYPVQRGVFDRNAIINAYKILDSGLVLVMFPEGTRTYGKGLVAAKNGVSHIALKASCQIIPITIIGAEMIFKHILKKAVIQVIIHSPIKPSSNQSPASLTETIMRKIASHYPPSLRGIYN